MPVLITCQFHADQIKSEGTSMETSFSTLYRKIPKISDTRKFAVLTLKVEQDGFTLD